MIQYIVEGSTFRIWEKWNDELDSWEQGMGWLETVGYINDRPICISIFIEKINGYEVLFWHATSELVDYKMIEEWFQLNHSALWYTDRPGQHCDEVNFMHCINYLRDL